MWPPYASLLIYVKWDEDSNCPMGILFVTYSYMPGTKNSVHNDFINSFSANKLTGFDNVSF